jgi:hypothetical protein
MVFSRTQIGAFLDKPIGASNFSFHPEILFRQNSQSFAFKSQNVDYDFVVNNSTLTVPIMAQYVLPGIRKRFYVQAGLVYARMLKNESSLYQYTLSGNNVFIEIDDRSVLPDSQLGLSAGGGFRIDVKNKYWLFEARYSQLNNANRKSNYLGIGDFMFCIGMAF